MKLNNSRAQFLFLSVCLLFIPPFSFAQPKTDGVKERSSSMPLITKGYYSIYRNAEKLNSPGNGRISVNTPADGVKRGSVSFAPQKGYYSIGKNAEKIRHQMINDSFNGGSKTSSGIIKNPVWPVISKGYYSIGNNAKALNK